MMKHQERAAKEETSQAQVVKSVGRTLQVLELFDELRAPQKIVAIATALNYPQSSAAALLKSMTKLGYLSYDRNTREFKPTDRVALLGSWISPPLFEEGRLLPLLKQLVKRTGQLAMLAARNDDSAQYIYLLGPPKTDPHTINLGKNVPLGRSAVGHVLLSAYDNADIKRIFHRVNAYSDSECPPVSVPELIKSVEGIRERKFIMSLDNVVFGYGAISMLIPLEYTDRPLALALGARSSVLRKKGDQYVEIMREEIAKYFARESTEDLQEATQGRHPVQAPFVGFGIRRVR